MKVCFVFPSIRNYGGFNSLGKHPDCIYVNHGVASLSAVLKQHGHTVSLIDLRECSGWSNFAFQVQEAKADLYGIYCPTLDYKDAETCAKIISDLEYTTIVGGPHPSVCPSKVAESPYFDYVFVGEGEVTLPHFLDNMNKYDRIIKGEHPDLDLLPFEDREIFNTKKILATKHPVFRTPFLNVMSGRNCPHNCAFCKPCGDIIFGKFRMRSLDHFMGEINHWTNRYAHALYGFKMLSIDDDAFTANPDYVAEFCDRYEKIGLPFVCQSRVDFIANHPDLVKRLKEVGLWMFSIGFESNNQRILNFLRKGTTVEQNWKAVEVCREFDVKIWMNYILGSPSESKEEALDTLNFVKASKPFHASPSFFTPIMGSDLYEYCKKESLLLSDDPADLGVRSPTTPKIRGVDYAWLRKHLVRDKPKLRTLMGKAVTKILGGVK